MFEAQIKAINSFDIQAEFRQAIREVSDEITQLNKDQLSKGERADGTKLPAYSDAYAKKKGKPKTPKTLYDKGDFYRGFYTAPMPTYLEMGSRDRKEDFLEKNWGEIHGLTPINLNKAQALILERLNAKIQNALT